MRRLLFAVVMLAPQAAFAQTDSPAANAERPFETGKILAHVQSAKDPKQSYALYLPSNYSGARTWPIIISSDPGGHRTAPLELQREAAERLGYILASSNNSRNGPWQPRAEATEVMMNDIQAHASIDSRRVYLAGFSGGARFSAQTAVMCKCSAGVLLSGAGFAGGLLPTADAIFPVFSTVGTDDFNYREMIPLQETLAKAGYPHWLRIFQGGHQWPPAEIMEEAFGWFRIQAMKEKREPLDPAFIQVQFSRAQGRAQSYEQSGDLLAAWREYLQTADTYRSLADIGAVGAKAEALGREKAVHEATKHERGEFSDEAQLVEGISPRLLAPASGDKAEESDRDLQLQILRLRQSAEREKHPAKARVYKRALGNVFVMSMESGDSLLEQKNVPAAMRLYDFATQAQPDSGWAWAQLGAARALAPKKKDAIAALRRAEELAVYKASFQTWLESEPALESLRRTPEFQSLLK